MNHDQDEKVTVTVIVVPHACTDLAWGVCMAKGDGVVHVPKSKVLAVRWQNGAAEKRNIAAMDMPKWLAIEKGLIGQRDTKTIDMFGG